MRGRRPAAAPDLFGRGTSLFLLLPRPVPRAARAFLVGATSRRKGGAPGANSRPSAEVPVEPAPGAREPDSGEDVQMMKRPRAAVPWEALWVVALVSFAVLAAEVALTRIFSVLFRAPYVFLIVSGAIGGLGLGGLV